MGSQSSVPLDPNGVFWLARKWLTLFAFVALIKMFGCKLMQRTGTWHTKTWSRRSFATLRATNASSIGVNPVLALQPWNNFLIRNSTNMKMMRNLITVSGTLRIEQYWQPLQPLTKNTKRLIDVIDDLTRHSYIAKLKITSSWYRTKSKATTGVMNTASYIPWLYTTWSLMVASNMILQNVLFQ